MPFRKYFYKEPEPVWKRPDDNRYFVERGEYPEVPRRNQAQVQADRLYSSDASVSGPDMYVDDSVHKRHGRLRRRMPLTTLEALLRIKANGLNSAKAA